LDPNILTYKPPFFSYEAWPSLGQQSITIAGWGQPTVAVWQRYEMFVSEQFSVVTFYRLAMRVWPEPAHSAVRYTWQHLWVRLCSDWPDRRRPRSTRIQSARPALPNLLHSVLLIGFHPSFTRKGICYGRRGRVVSIGEVPDSNIGP
jgi:hypothetical protein